MKYILAALLFPLFCSAQIEVKKSATKFTVGSVKDDELYGLVINDDTTYVWLYRNAEYKTIVDIQSISFKNQDSVLVELYKTLTTVFAEENKDNKDYKVEFKLGDTNVIAGNYKSMGVVSILFWTNKGHAFYTKKQLDKLFGK